MPILAGRDEQPFIKAVTSVSQVDLEARKQQEGGNNQKDVQKYYGFSGPSDGLSGLCLHHPYLTEELRALPPWASGKHRPAAKSRS